MNGLVSNLELDKWKISYRVFIIFLPSDYHSCSRL